MTRFATLASPLGTLAVTIKHDRLCALDIGAECQPVPNEAHAILKQLQTELAAYFVDHRCRFSIPLALSGTPFQKRVWQALRKIPAGKTLTYGQLAAKLQSGPRAVGNACRANPIPILVPCHRVIGKHGIGGYAGQTSGERLAVKRWLLRHEGVEID